MATRAHALLDHLGWTQKDLADWLGVDRSTVSRLVAGRPEGGPIARLLDQLARAHGRPDLAAAALASASARQAPRPAARRAP
jgi:transcriptional regulator with XRE-family HTH domain